MNFRGPPTKKMLSQPLVPRQHDLLLKLKKSASGENQANRRNLTFYVNLFVYEPLAKVFFGCLSICNKWASRAGPWYSVFAKKTLCHGRRQWSL